MEDVDGAANAGTVHALYSNATGFSTAGNQVLRQHDFGITTDSRDHFGFSLTADDFNRDGYSDLLVSVPYADVGDVQDAGVINPILGSPTGLVDIFQKTWQINPFTEGDNYGWQFSGMTQTLR